MLPINVLASATLANDPSFDPNALAQVIAPLFAGMRCREAL
jgi:hypothetical protein